MLPGVPKSALGLLACVLALAGTARAESAGVIEEIIVTAEKREASAQETSIAITAYSGEDLDLRGINDIEGLQFSAPNLVISPNAQSPVTYAYIRGIGSDQLVAGFDPGVAYHVDGVYVGQPSAMPGDLWDMERVEVLRGPQGTLYGRNTTGGSINVITNDPVDGLGFRGDVTAGNYDRQRFRGVANAGNEQLAARIAYQDDENDGYQENLTGADGDRIDFHSLRGKVRAAFGERGELMLTYQNFKNTGPQSQKRREPFGPVELAPGFILNVYDGAIPNPDDPRKVAKDYPEKLDLDNDFYSARLSWDFDAVSVVATVARIDNEWFQGSDIDMSNNPVQFQEWTMETEQNTQELQILSAGEGPWEWIVGYFHFDEDLDSDYVFQDSSIAGFTFMNGGILDTESNAVYGQVSYDFRDRGTPLRLTAGLRWTRDRKEIDEYQQIPQFAVDLAGAMDEEWERMSGTAGLDWFLSDDVMVYASYDHGYKGGGFSLGQFDAYDPETVDAFEVGVKSQFWQHRAQVNVAAFYNDYQDLQVNFLEFTSFTTDNAAEATIKGIEIESLFVPVANLTLGANVTWLDAKFDRYQFSPTIDLSGETLNRAPEYTAALWAQYDWPLGDAGTVTARADYYWQDEVYYRVQNIPRHREGSFFTADVRLVWTSASQRWTVDAFVQNLTDEDNQRGLTVSDGLSTGNNSFVSYFPPRVYGLRLGFQIGDH